MERVFKLLTESRQFSKINVAFLKFQLLYFIYPLTVL